MIFRPIMRSFLAPFFLIFIYFFSAHVSATPIDAGYSSIELVSERRAVRSGETASFGLRLKPQANWHTYWINPGDAGKSVRVAWENADGIVAGDMQLPAPHLVPFMGLVSYGYDEDTLVIFDVDVPKSYKDGDTLSLTGAANWLVCDDKSCVPQDADIAIDVVVGASGGEGLTQEFATARAKIPKRVDWSATYAPYAPYGEDGVLFHVEMPEEIAGAHHLDLFPSAQKIIDHATMIRADIDTGGVAFLAEKGPRLKRTATSDLVIVVETKDSPRQAYIMAASRGDLSALTATARAGASKAAGTTTAHGSADGSNAGNTDLGQARPETTFASKAAKLFGAIGFAILGGIILNLMPCVLPILSLKALGLVKMSGEDLSHARMNGLVYTAGILASFLAFALVLVALRSAGGFAGWGFQMQHPAVLVVLILLMGTIGANLAGLFEFSSRLAGAGQGLAQGGGLKSEFFTGVLAVVVAAPCTAPFMAGALGYAMIQPLLITILVFLGLGLGLALPYLLLCYFPTLRKWMPKPGAWMNSFKQLLAFPMFATALWLLWVLGNQVGLEYVLGVLLLALLLAMAFWAYLKGGQSSVKLLWNIFALVILGGGIWMATSLPGLKASKQVGEHTGKLNAQPYSLTKLENLLADKQSVFVYFTADWCISCKVNEKAALNKEVVANAFVDKNIQVLVGDWTNPDDEIAKILKRFGRVGVPLYLYYPVGETNIDKAKILPQILTPNIVLNAL